MKKPRVKKNNNDETDIKGTFEELCVNVNCHGKRHQVECFIKTTEVIGNDIGQECGKDMKNLVFDEMELSLSVLQEKSVKMKIAKKMSMETTVNQTSTKSARQKCSW